MEEEIPYLATLNHVNIAMGDSILKEVTSYVKAGEGKTRVIDLIDYLLVDDGHFGADQITIADLVRDEIEKTNRIPRIDKFGKNLKEGLRELWQLYRAGSLNNIAPDDNSFYQLMEKRVDYDIDQFLRLETLGVTLRDQEGKWRHIPNGIKNTIGSVDFLIETALALPLFERYEAEGKLYMGLNIVVSGRESTFL